MKNWLLPLSFLFLTLPAFATPESICPGGSGPRADIDFCVDFEQYGNAACGTGQEAGCATANGLGSLSVSQASHFAIKDCSTAGEGAAVLGTGCIYGSGNVGSTGPGYSNKTPGTFSTSAALRFYVKFGKGYLQTSGPSANHGPAISGSDGAGCGSTATMDFQAGQMAWLVEGSGCPNSTGSFSLPNNIDSSLVLKDNKWYAIEIDVTMNTTFSGSGVHQGNGVWKAYVDDVLVSSYTDINYRGSNAAATWRDTYLARSYYGHGVPSWKPKIFFDQFVYSNTGTHIGLASGASVGTASTKAYYNSCSYSTWAGQASDSDCRVTGNSAVPFSITTGDGQCIQSLVWRDTPLLQSGTVHNTYLTNGVVCAGPPAIINGAMKVDVASGHGSGISEVPSSMSVGYTTQTVHSWLYAAGTNDYTTPTPVMGFTRYWATLNYDKYVGICRLANGHVGLCYNNVGTKTSTDTGTTWTTDAWHEAQLLVDSTDHVYLYWDGSYLLNGTASAQALWVWMGDDVSGGPRNQVVGVFDYTGTGNFVIYYDDSDELAPSAVDCIGWDVDDCPFGAATPTPSPSPSPTPTPASVSASWRGRFR